MIRNDVMTDVVHVSYISSNATITMLPCHVYNDM